MPDIKQLFLTAYVCLAFGVLLYVFYQGIMSVLETNRLHREIEKSQREKKDECDRILNDPQYRDLTHLVEWLFKYSKLDCPYSDWYMKTDLPIWGTNGDWCIEDKSEELFGKMTKRVYKKVNGEWKLRGYVRINDKPKDDGSLKTHSADILGGPGAWTMP